MVNSFEISLKKNVFAPLRILNLFIKYFVNPFVDIVFSDSSFDSFSTSTSFVLIEVMFLLKFLSLFSKFIF